MRVVLLTVLALLGFAANSLLCRAALRAHTIDPITFTGVRIVAGALTLYVISRARPSKKPTAGGGGGGGGEERGKTSILVSAIFLFTYAIGFSLAYVDLNAGTGALLLFGSVQATMVGVGFVRGGERPSAREWIGLVLALGGLVLLVLPSLTSPPPLAAGLMIMAGAAWGGYSLRGRGLANPVNATASNFIYAAPIAGIASLIGHFVVQNTFAEPRGILLAMASGAIASGIGYSIWYAALPSLSATRAGIVQLAVPIVAAVGGVAFFGELVTSRLAIAAGAILGGIAIATIRRK